MDASWIHRVQHWSHNLCFKQCGYLLTQVFRVVLKIDSVLEMQFVRICGKDIDADAFIVASPNALFSVCNTVALGTTMSIHPSVTKELV